MMSSKKMEREKTKMNSDIKVFSEPELEFRYIQKAKDPRDGLGIFGPYDADLPSSPQLNYIILGSPEGITAFDDWTKRINFPVVDAPKDNFRLWPPFPGFEVAFAKKFPETPVWSYHIDNQELIEASKFSDPYQRAHNVVDKFLEGMRAANKRDENIGVAICVVPEEVWKNCRPQSIVNDYVGEKIDSKRLRSRKAGQLEIFSDYDPEHYQLSRDFRRQLKARSMEYDIPIQIIRDTTLRLSNENNLGQRQLTPLSDRMWNISTTIYYKCGGKPWRLVTAREGVCYIGIAFRRVEGEDDTACCAAQMFLNSGDGIVFLGEYGPWYSPKDKQYHLSKQAASKLLAGVLDTYNQLEGKPLKEVFLHSRSDISDDEYQGYLAACPRGIKLVGIRVRRDRMDSPRLYRIGEMPVYRGTFWQLSDKTGYLWGSGFAARPASYRGWEVPVPIRIDIQHGDASIERVAHDIFGLTKLNYNACHLGDSEPVTVGFSDAVGEILISNPTIEKRRPNFKFYI